MYEEEVGLNREFHGTPLAKLKDDLISMIIIFSARSKKQSYYELYYIIYLFIENPTPKLYMAPKMVRFKICA